MSSSPTFIGPLPADLQRIADETLAADSAAAELEPMSIVLQRREAEVAELFIQAGVALYSGDDCGRATLGQALAQSRASAWLAAADPAGCWDCLLAATPCEQHRRLTPSYLPSLAHGRATEPEWRRFGSDAT